ncbi:hypothetical protein [Dyella sp.]|uniref:glycosyl-4,4'-diaponeurosporenoate acyltransferase CrtO family protein n=1 Tax=Dyella sp. TaxID=1869338 RepID=UPI002B48D830|nr:hypothetical protein [Dyella sp.]HKT26679.1 hypothetical protein [Dyella sp.]
MRLWLGIGKAVVVGAFFCLCAVMWGRVEGVGSPWLGLFGMFYFMGTAKSAEPQLLFRMPGGLRAVDLNATRAGTQDRWGIRRFGSFLRNTPFRYLNNSVYLTGRAQNLPELLRKVESAEAIHFWAAVLFTPYIAYIAFRGLFAEALLFVLIQVAFNLYPILHLRLVRARLTRLLDFRRDQASAVVQ